MDIGGFLNGALFVAFVGILGIIVGSLIGYDQAKKQRQYEYRKDLAAAIRTACVDFLKVAFAGDDLTKEGMKKYLTDLTAVYAPVSLLSSKDVIQNISKFLGVPNTYWKGLKMIKWLRSAN